MAVVTMRQLLESGVHFGHQTRRWNPKMKRFIFTERNGIYIIDLQRSLLDIDRAYEFVKETVAHGGTVLFAGTKKQAQEPVAEQAARVGMPYVNQRWLGGMLTNFGTVHKRLQRLKELEEIDFEDVAASGLTKKELLVLKREKDKLERSLGGIRDMAKVPSAVWVIDTKKEHLAVAEARKLKIPIIAILDTNCDPDEVDYGIPGNDDAIRSVALLTRVIADAVAEGLVARHSGAAPGGTTTDVEPLAEWERELLATEGTVTEGTATEGTATRGAATGGAEPDGSDAIVVEKTPEDGGMVASRAAVATAPAEEIEDVGDVEADVDLTRPVPVGDAWPAATEEPAEEPEPVVARETLGAPADEAGSAGVPAVGAEPEPAPQAKTEPEPEPEPEPASVGVPAVEEVAPAPALAEPTGRAKQQVEEARGTKPGSPARPAAKPAATEQA